MNLSPILVLGANGKTGRRIVEQLSRKGHAVRKGSRRADPAFDWDHPHTWPAVLLGVGAMYISYYPDLAARGAPAAISGLSSLAVTAGVKRIVLLSGRGEANAMRCEDIVRQCGAPFTIIRASWFSQNFSEGHLLQPVLSGTVALPAGDVREPFVDADDIADVAVAALTEERHAGQLYEVTGPRLLSFSEAVSEIAAAAGRRVRYQAISSDQYRAAITKQAGPALANMLTDLLAEVLDGRNAMLADGVQRALLRQPRDFAEYCHTAAASGAWSRPIR